jgi:hypothetical protein
MRGHNTNRFISVLCTTQDDAPVLYIRKSSHSSGTQAIEKPGRLGGGDIGKPGSTKL